MQAEGVGAYFLDSLYSDIDSLIISAGMHFVHFGKYHRLLSKLGGLHLSGSTWRSAPRDDRILRMNTTVRLRPALARQLVKIAAESKQDLSSLADDALAQFVRSHRETVHLTGSKANLRRLREAHAEIEAEIARRKRQAA